MELHLLPKCTGRGNRLEGSKTPAATLLSDQRISACEKLCRGSLTRHRESQAQSRLHSIMVTWGQKQNKGLITPVPPPSSALWKVVSVSEDPYPQIPQQFLSACRRRTEFRSKNALCRKKVGLKGKRTTFVFTFSPGLTVITLFNGVLSSHICPIDVV